MNASQLLSLLGQQLLPGLIQLARATNPGASDDQLVSLVDGDLKHYLRKKIGWAVDILWGFSEFQAGLDAAIRQSIASTPAISLGN